MTGIIFALKTGIPWQYLPATSEFPSGFTCLRWLKKWHRAGVWHKLLAVLLSELRHEKKIDWRRAIVDSASVRASHGGQKTGRNPVDRGKLGSKRHVITEAHGIPLATILTGANRHDVTQLLPLLEKIPKVQGQRGRPKQKPERVQGDRAYDSEPHRRALKKEDNSGSRQTPHRAWQWIGAIPVGGGTHLVLAPSV
jgi:transposase